MRHKRNRGGKVKSRGKRYCERCRDSFGRREMSKMIASTGVWSERKTSLACYLSGLS